MITQKENQIKKYIMLSIETMNRMPTYAEMCCDIPIGRGSLNRILARLLKNKFLKRSVQTIPYELN